MMHIFSMKGKTKKMQIKPMADPAILYVPLLQHIGKPATPIVKAGDYVTKYQLIGEAAEGLSANIHSPVSGKVLEVKEHRLADGSMVAAVAIENDYKDVEGPQSGYDYNTLTIDQLVDIIQTNGIVGEGGAQFPTAIKYSLNGQKIDTFIINGTECEPYLTADYALMNERSSELFEGISIINKILSPRQVVLSIEEQNRELQKVFAPYLQKGEYKNVKIIILPNQYPQGGELQLIKSVTGIEIPRNQLPRAYGYMVSNVATLCSIRQAVVCNRPLVSRIITVSGEASSVQGNYEVKIGTPISHIIQILGLKTTNRNIILGGPLMGKYIEYFDAPIIKGSSGVLFFEKKKIKRSNCISCGYCVDVCPMHLMPMKFEENYRKGRYFNMEKYRLSSCIECAACEYICPSDVPLIESIKEGKIKLKELANAIQ